MSQPINNALSNFDNLVESTSGGKTGFASKITSSLSASSLGELAGNLTSNLTSSVGSFLSDKIKKLNELTNNLAKKYGLTDKLAKLQEFASKYLSNGLDFLNDMKDDALKQLRNAAVNYVSNIMDDFEKQLMSTVYVNEANLAITLQTLYYQGADLAYDNHYIRKMTLSRDWIETLKFLDSAYKINYEYNYYGLEDDLDLCVKNSCWKNTHYIFKHLYKTYNSCEEDIAVNSKSKKLIEEDKPYTYESDEKWIMYSNNIENLKSVLDKISIMMKTYFKKLFVNSLAHLGEKGVRSFFSSFSKILKPSMFSSDGDFPITDMDLAIMLPYFKEHEVTDADLNYMAEQNEESNRYSEKSNNLINDQNDKQTSYVNDKLAKFRSNALKEYSKNKNALANVAIRSGSSGVYEQTIDRYAAKGQNSPKNKIKFRANPLNNDDLLLEAAMVDKKDYVIPRNTNMKALYILLSSSEIYGTDRMINNAFHKRCKLPTMNSLNASADKIKGILGSSLVVQSMFDLSNAIDASAYEFVKRTEAFYFDPRQNVENLPLEGIEHLVNTYYDPKIGKFVEKKNDSTDVNEDNDEVIEDTDPSEYITNGPISADSNNASNPSTNSTINNLLDANTAAKSDTVNSIRYASNIPMIKKRDMIIDCLINIYDSIDSRHYETIHVDKILEYICEYVFGKTGIDTKDKIYGMFEYSTNDSLVLNSKNLIAMANLNLISNVIHSDNSKSYTNVEKIINVIIQLFARELGVVGFARSIALYDREFLASYFKTLFTDEIAYLKRISSNPNDVEYKNFYTYKDKLTSKINSFDRKGLFGYNDDRNRIQYTNLITGDWNTICVTSYGTFVGGSDNTPNNGIMKLNEDTCKFVKTNIKDGNWTDIFECANKVFFVKNNKELYVLTDSGNIIATDIANFDEYEIIHIKEVDVFILASIKDKGIKHWNGSKFDSLTNTGSGWKYKNIKYGFVLYSTETESSIFTINKNGSVINTGLSKKVTDISYTVRHNHITITTPGGSGNPNAGSVPPTIIETNSYYLIILVGTYDGVYEITNMSEEEYNFNLTNIEYHRSTLLNWDNIVIPIFRSETSSNFLTHNKEFTVNFETEYEGIVIPTNPNYPIGVKIDVGSTYPEIEIIKNFSRFIYLGVSGNDVYFKDKNKIDVPIQTVENNITRNNIEKNEFFEYNNIIFSREKSNVNNTSEVIEKLFIFDNDKHFILEGKGWNPIKCGNVLFITNTLSKNNLGGIYVLNYSLSDTESYITTISTTLTNITTGNWKLIESDDYIFALSILGTNKGIKVTSKTTTTFNNLENAPITYGDIGATCYDSDKHLIYFGQERSNYVLDIDIVSSKPAFDIDEYIFPLYDYQLVKLIEYIQGSKTETVKNSFIEMLKNCSDETTEDGGSGGNTGDDNSGNDGDTSNNNLSDVIAAMQKTINEMESSLSNVEKNSDIYQDLLIYKQARDEFDIDDNKVLNSLLLDMIVNYDYSSEYNGSDIGTDKNTMLRRLSLRDRKMYIQNLYNNDESVKNNMLSDEFLNDDPNPPQTSGV